MQSSLLPCYLVSLKLKYITQHPIPNTFSLCSFLCVREQVSHPYKITGKIMAWCISVFIFLDRKL